MKVAVLGGTGAMGSRVGALLAGRGHEVVAVSRASGVDVAAGTGIDEALAGVDVVVDCLNIATAARKPAVEFFTAAARECAAAARRQGVQKVVVLSILNVTDDVVRRGIGYYAGKAAQLDTYAEAGLPTTVVATTAWFTLAELFLHQIRVGPVALVSTMMLQPVHPDAAAGALADAVEEPAGREIRVWGPERLRADVMARDFARATGRSVRVLGVPFPGRRFRHSALLPRGIGVQDERRYADWLMEQETPV